MVDNILIDRIRISGFRGIKNLEMSLPRVAVLIGANNSGKTSILKALHLAIGDYSRYLSEEDFHIGIDEKRVGNILVDVRIVPIDANQKRVNAFDEAWATEFGDKIKAEANGNQYVVIRVRAKPNEIKGGFDALKYTLEKWPEFSSWQTEKVKETKLSSRLESMPFVSIEAQRDIHQELGEKTSFVGKILSNIEYKAEDINNLEGLIKSLNDEAVDKSASLKKFKDHLEQLNQSFHGRGNVEITPFPKKIRDLAKHFSVNFGETPNTTFSMEYHGMGTRSWASMLTVKAFIELMAAKHEEEKEVFCPILSAEEPEAHLHPNAQKTLYNQLAKTKGQIIVSTHSPYFTAMSDILDIRLLRRENSEIVSRDLKGKITKNDKKILAREVVLTRGEILFSRALILCEGITEEQVMPAMFEVHTGKSLFSLGISCINVGGENYSPFIKLACSLGIPTYIVSDNDGSTKIKVEAQLRRVRVEMSNALNADIFGISYLHGTNDFEAELLKELTLRDEIVSSLVLSETKAADNERYRNAKFKELNALDDDGILETMRSQKASYSGFLADILKNNPNSRTSDEMIPAAVQEAFTAIKGWFEI